MFHVQSKKLPVKASTPCFFCIVGNQMQGNLPIGHKSRLLTVEVAHSVISLNVIPVACALIVPAERSNPGIQITFSEILAVHTKNWKNSANKSIFINLHATS